VHDVLGQEMTGFKMDVKWLADRLAALDGPEDTGPLLDKLNSMSRQLEQTMQTIRRISTELRPAVLDALGVVAALEWQAADFGRRAGIQCDFVSSHEDIDLDDERATAVFRIFQEALTNVARHAKATRVEAELALSGLDLLLVVRDNGVGISRVQAGSTRTLGLLGMQERAMMFGGSVCVEGRPGQGTAVTLSMPLGA
jgi:signal transduction histidine kinase